MLKALGAGVAAGVIFLLEYCLPEEDDAPIDGDGA